MNMKDKKHVGLPDYNVESKKKRRAEKEAAPKKRIMKFPAEALDFCEESSAATPFKSHAERPKMSALVGIICCHFL